MCPISRPGKCLVRDRRMKKTRLTCLSGALVPYAKIPARPGFQVPFAAAIRKEVDMPTRAAMNRQ